MKRLTILSLLGLLSINAQAKELTPDQIMNEAYPSLMEKIKQSSPTTYGLHQCSEDTRVYGTYSNTSSQLELTYTPIIHTERIGPTGLVSESITFTYLQNSGSLIVDPQPKAAEKYELLEEMVFIYGPNSNEDPTTIPIVNQMLKRTLDVINNGKPCPK